MMSPIVSRCHSFELNLNSRIKLGRSGGSSVCEMIEIKSQFFKGISKALGIMLDMVKMTTFSCSAC